MNGITTHVLDTVLGKPAVGIIVRLEKRDAADWIPISVSATDADGRCRDLITQSPSGTYRLTFSTGSYLERLGRSTIYPQISVTFHCSGEPHYHLPLLLSDNSYTTYRGS
jgi:5-hydroxyisourate hydrolase